MQGDELGIGEKKMRKTKDNLVLECVLTDKEKLDYSKTLSEKITEKQRLEESLKSVQTQMKADITSCEGTINSIADKINTGKEYRHVECEIKYDFKKGMKRWIRIDTGKEAKVETIREDELQEEFSTK
jgi:hypothetical protein